MMHIFKTVADNAALCGARPKPREELGIDVWKKVEVEKVDCIKCRSVFLGIYSSETYCRRAIQRQSVNYPHATVGKAIINDDWGVSARCDLDDHIGSLPVESETRNILAYLVHLLVANHKATLIEARKTRLAMEKLLKLVTRRDEEMKS